MPKNSQNGQTRRPPTKYRIFAIRRSGPKRGERVDLGVFEAYVGHKAKGQAVAAWAKRMGWAKLKERSRTTGLSYDVRGWTFRIQLVKTADVTITVTAEPGTCSKCGQDYSSTSVEDDGGEFDNDLFDDDTHERDAEDAVEDRTEDYKKAGRVVRVVHVTKTGRL